MPEYRLMDYFDWLDEFVPMTDEHIEDFDDPRIKEADPACVWTEVDTDAGVRIASGWHYVNRLAYWITKVPVPEGTFVEVD